MTQTPSHTWGASQAAPSFLLTSTDFLRRRDGTKSTIRCRTHSSLTWGIAMPPLFFERYSTDGLSDLFIWIMLCCHSVVCCRGCYPDRALFLRNNQKSMSLFAVPCQFCHKWIVTSDTTQRVPGSTHVVGRHTSTDVLSKRRSNHSFRILNRLITFKVNFPGKKEPDSDTTMNVSRKITQWTIHWQRFQYLSYSAFLSVLSSG